MNRKNSLRFHFMVMGVKSQGHKLQVRKMLNPDFALGFEENGLNLCQNKACEQKYHSRTRCSTARTLLRVKRSYGKELETFYQNPNTNSGLKGVSYEVPPR